MNKTEEKTYYLVKVKDGIGKYMHEDIEEYFISTDPDNGIKLVKRGDYWQIIRIKRTDDSIQTYENELHKEIALALVENFNCYIQKKKRYYVDNWIIEDFKYYAIATPKIRASIDKDVKFPDIVETATELEMKDVDLLILW